LNITELIKHPEQLNKETLYDLRSLIALYPFYQTARLLMLQNLYLLHDPTFDEELRRAAAYITDRRVIFNLVEANHYKPKRPQVQIPEGNRTVSLIDNFLSSIPAEAEETENEKTEEKVHHRKHTAADATIDYISYLIATDFEEETSEEETYEPEMKGQSLIDTFIEGDGFNLQDKPEYKPEVSTEPEDSEKLPEEEYLTETLAGIYIKQGKYLKALEIIKRLNLNIPKKNAYFADQIRFLEKLIVNSGQKIEK
jgi:hypothetical protein